MITQDTVKAIDCMTQHIVVFRAQSTHGKTADFAEPCQTCRYAKSCSFDWVSVMHPLLSQSSVHVSMLHPCDLSPSEEAERREFLRSALLDATPEHRRKLLEKLNIGGRS